MLPGHNCANLSKNSLHWRTYIRWILGQYLNSLHFLFMSLTHSHTHARTNLALAKRVQTREKFPVILLSHSSPRTKKPTVSLVSSPTALLKTWEWVRRLLATEMNSEEHNQVLEALRRRLQAWKVWRRGIRVLPRRSEEHGSTVMALQDVERRVAVLDPRVAALALQGVAQRITALALCDWNGRTSREEEIDSNRLPLLSIVSRKVWC